MNKEYKIGYIYDESEVKEVADFLNKNQTLMSSEIDPIVRKIDGKEIKVRRFKIIEIPIDVLQDQVRNKRNWYLEKYIDPIVTNPLRWEELSSEEQSQYRNYRKYLLDYTKAEKWWLKLPLTFEDWKKAN